MSPFEFFFWTLAVGFAGVVLIGLIQLALELRDIYKNS